MENLTYNILPQEYIQTNNGDVYKVLQNHYLKLSPWKDGEDRRVYEENIGDYKIISYKNVYYFNAILKELQKDITYCKEALSYYECGTDY